MPQKIESEINFFSRERREPIYDPKVAANVVTLAHLSKDAVILDAGCGEGYWADCFARKGYRTIGIDISKIAIEKAKKKALPKQIFQVGNLLVKRQLNQEKFDAVIFGGILHHFPSETDLKLILANTVTCLKPFGKIVLIEPNGSNFIVSLSRVLGRFFARLYPLKIASDNETIYSIKQYKNLLTENNLEILHLESCAHSITGKIRRGDGFLGLLIHTRDMMFKILWKILPEPYRGNEVIIIARLITLPK